MQFINSFHENFTRADLQALPVRFRSYIIKRYADCMAGEITEAAKIGKTSHTISAPSIKDKYRDSVMRCGVGVHDVITPEEAVEGLKAKFPGCSVVLKDDWVDVCPGMRQHRSEIVIDWS